MMNNQMELSFDRSTTPRTQLRRQRRMRRASWWFEQMRLVVDRAFEAGGGEPRPEQIYLTLRVGSN